MPTWFSRKHEGPQAQSKREIPDGIWVKCPDCGEILYRKEVERNQWVCVRCSHHFRISATDYIRLLVDPDSFEEYFAGVSSLDPLKFKDTLRYADRVKNAESGGR